MGKKAPTPPPAPDYVGAANAERRGNMQMARYNTQANRVNQSTPWGSLAYTNNQTFDTAGYDRAMSDWRASGGNGAHMPQRGEFNTDQWSQTETLSPQLQRALDDQFSIMEERSGVSRDMLNRVRDSYSANFDPKRLEEYLSGVGSVDTSRVGTAGNFMSGARIDPRLGQMQGVNLDSLGNVRGLRSDASIDTDVYGATRTGKPIDLNAPQFGPNRQDEYSKAAYNAQMALLQPDLDKREERLRNSLALQGLSPGSQASDGAMGEFNDGRSRQLNALANQSVLTGNELSQRDFSSELSGFRAGNEAVGQQFSQGMERFLAGNQAQGQRFGMDEARFRSGKERMLANASLRGQENDAQQQAFQQLLARGTFDNSAAAQQFGMDQAYFDNSLRTLDANSRLQSQYNNAQQQAYGQALQNYGANWQQDSTLRNLPLNEMNALLTGQQVQSPEFKPYALQQFVPGADIGGAVDAQGSYDRQAWNAQAAGVASQNGSTASTLGSLASMIGMFAPSDERLKKDIEKVGETGGGSNVYEWEWNKKAKELGLAGKPTVGVIAQEHPHATKKSKSGYLMVDYSKVR